MEEEPATQSKPLDDEDINILKSYVRKERAF